MHRHLTVADIPDQFQAGDHVDVRYLADPGWNSPPGGYTIDHVNGDNSFTVTGLTLGLEECLPSSEFGCGTAAEVISWDQENFTLAGGSGSGIDTLHKSFTFHADFWNTWQQAALTKLENDCALGTYCDTLGAVPNNDFVDGLP